MKCACATKQRKRQRRSARGTERRVRTLRGKTDASFARQAQEIERSSHSIARDRGDFASSFLFSLVRVMRANVTHSSHGINPYQFLSTTTTTITTVPVIPVEYTVRFLSPPPRSSLVSTTVAVSRGRRDTLSSSWLTAKESGFFPPAGILLIAATIRRHEPTDWYRDTTVSDR